MIKVIAQAGERAPEILLYDTIADFDSDRDGYMTAKSLISHVKALGDISELTLRINSVGGDVYQALAIYNYLQKHSAVITVVVDGIAASSASLVAMSGDKIIMHENSMLMIHNPVGAVTGDGNELREQAEILDKIRDLFVNAYVLKTGLPAEKVTEYMNNESWFTASEAKELNFCDEILPALDIAACVKKYTGYAKSDPPAPVSESEKRIIDKLDKLDKLMNLYRNDGMSVTGITPSFQTKPDMIDTIAAKINTMRGV